MTLADAFELSKHAIVTVATPSICQICIDNRVWLVRILTGDIWKGASSEVTEWNTRGSAALIFPIVFQSSGLRKRDAGLFSHKTFSRSLSRCFCDNRKWTETLAVGCLFNTDATRNRCQRSASAKIEAIRLKACRIFQAPILFCNQKLPLVRNFKENAFGRSSLNFIELQEKHVT